MLYLPRAAHFSSLTRLPEGANIGRLYRGEEAENLYDSTALTVEHFPEDCYTDVPGLCKVSTLEELEAQSWSLNPGLYVGVAHEWRKTLPFPRRPYDPTQQRQRSHQALKLP